MKFESLAANLNPRMAQLAAKIRQRFFQRPKLCLQGLASTSESGGPGKRVNWILSRALLKHDTFSVPKGLSASQRRATLSLMIKRWSPFQSAGHVVQWSGSQASVYAWDTVKIDHAITLAGHDRGLCKIIPETFIRAPLSDGVRLVAMIDGCEGQVWRDGFLMATRWWPAAPADSEWSAFIRASRIGPMRPDLARPEITETPIQDESWATRPNYLEDAWLLLDTPRYRVAAASLALALPLFLGAKWAAIAVRTADLKTELDRLYVASEPVRVQRDATLANLDTVDQILALNPLPPQFEAMARSFELLNGYDVIITDWTYGAGSLEFSIQGQSDLDATRYIELFERDPLFANVSARTLPQPRALRLRLDIVNVTDTQA